MNDEPNVTPRPFPLRTMAFGWCVLAMLFLCIGAWAGLAPLQSAVVSPGVITAAGFRKQVQHLEGGIVERVLVTDGQQVRAGQELVRLRDVQPRAVLQRLRQQVTESIAVVARLRAESLESRELSIPAAEEHMDFRDGLERAFTAQQQLLLSRAAALGEQREKFSRRARQAREESRGVEARIQSKRQEHNLASQSLAAIQTAVENGALPNNALLESGRDVAALEGDLSRLRADLAKLRQTVAELETASKEATAIHIAETMDALRDEENTLHELRMAYLGAKDVLDRTRVVSPIDGIVVNLQLHTQDGVVTPGQTLLEVVPVDDELVVDAYIHPDDIDEVRTGMVADVRLTSISRRRRVPLDGLVIDVSADRIDSSGGLGHYRARIRLDEDRDDLLVGMGVDVFIRTGARTPLEYLLGPISDAIAVGLRES